MNIIILLSYRRNIIKMNDTDIDLNIDNYSFADILNLFRLDADKPPSEPDLKKCRDMVEKLHPSRSALNGSYYELFNSAYNVLDARHRRGRGWGGNDDDGGVPPYGIYSISQSKTQAQAVLQAQAVIPAAVPGCYAPQPLSTRMVTIHTEDRDVLKYPFENLFEVNLPTVIKNVQSIELFDITLPMFYYNVSDYFQNTKMWFSVPTYFNDPVEITVPSGCYTPDDLCSELVKQLNEATATTLFAAGVYVSQSTLYSQFIVTYSAIERKFTFRNMQDGFILWFDIKSVYDDCQFVCWKMLQNWGLGYNLGFYKKAYDVTVAPPPNGLNLNAHLSASVGLYVTSTNVAELDAYNTIYMEIDTFNWIDEINPFSIATTDLNSNDYNGSVNNSFAKLILSNISKCYVPVKKFKRLLPHMVEKIGRLKFKFRYHNGILVDFNHQPFNFALRFESRFNCA